jgi:hypothetical protein
MIVSGFLLAEQSDPQDKKTAPNAKAYNVGPARSEIIIDGVLDEQAWADATVGDLPYEWMPGDNIPPPVDTDFLITFSTDYLYIAMRCYDPNPAQIRAHLMDRDDMDYFIQDDHISILIDPFNDERRGFQFRVNALGVQADANFSELEGYEDFSWDAIWKSGGKISDWGYGIEIAIPFNQLRFPGGEEIQTWGFSAERSYPRSVRHRITSHRRDRDQLCYLCQMNKVTGFQGMHPGLNLEIDPTLTSNRTDQREDFPGGKMKSGAVEADPGVTVRWGITPNLILNAAANPDFSQVEADIAQLEVNTRFALRYPEKRPFFLEGADFFLTPIEIVFTRTVADPAGGMKFTGKVGKYAFGFFGVYDEINNLLIPSNQGSAATSLEQGIPSGVFRIRRDIGQGSAFGALYTGRVGENYYNHVAGLDGFFRLSQTKTLSVQYLHAETDYPSETALAFGQELSAFRGDAFLAEFMHFSRNWFYILSYRDLSPGFRADYGYIPRVDLRRINGTLTRFIWGERGDWYNRLGFGANGYVIYDYDKKLTDGLVELNVTYMGPLQSNVYLSYQRLREFYFQNDYDLDQVVFFGEIKPAGGLNFNMTAMYGDAIDYSNARESRILMLSPFAEFGLGRHVSLNLRHNFQRLGLEGTKILQANLSQMRLVYNFNVRSFVRLIIQHLHVSRNTDLYLFPIDATTQTFFTQLLFSYKLNPQTVLFLGYSDNYLGMTNVDITQADRTFFIKLGYAWTK